MIDLLLARSGRARRLRTPGIRPALEGLEDRMLLYAASGNHFTFGSRITYSFVPDGTQIAAGAPASNLNAAMNARGISTQAWENAFRAAAAAWENVANINLVEVPDNGAAYGAPGNQQGDSQFGDIRIGGNTTTNGLALTFLPPPANGGTLAGDMAFNTTVAWNTGSDYDIQTVALHEFGHALGLDHSSVSTAVMYASYNAIKQSLTTDDVSGIQYVWGTRPPDAYEGTGGNNTVSTATPISNLLNGGQQLSLNADIASSSDQDWYYIVAPAGTTSTMTVTMQSSNLSSLAPRLSVFNSAKQSLATASASGAYGATVSISIGGISAGQGFYLRALPAGGGGAVAGAYALQVNFSGSQMPPAAPPNTVVASQPDAGGGSTPEVSQPGTHHHGGDDTVVIGGRRYNGDVFAAKTHTGAAHPRRGRGIPTGTTGHRAPGHSHRLGHA